LTQHFGWRSVFWINLPIGALVAYLAAKHLPAAAPRKRGPFDFAGVVTLALGLLGLTAGLNQIGHGHAPPLESLAKTHVWGPLVGGILLLGIFALVEARAASPIIRPAHLFRRNLAIANALSFAGGTAEAGMAFAPAFAMAALNYSKQQAGSLVTVVAVAMFFGNPTTGMLLDRVGARNVLLVGTVLTALGNYLFGHSSSTFGFVVNLSLLGLGLSALLGAPLRYIAANETEEGDRAAAQGVLTVFSSSGISLGAAIAGALVASGARAEQPLEGYRQAYTVVGLLALVGFVLALMLRSRAAPTPR
jgi:MFS family permease